MRKLQTHSAWLLKFLVRHGPYCVTTAMPSTAPMGLSMTTMRGLEKRGYARERHSGIFEATEEGKRIATQYKETGERNDI